MRGILDTEKHLPMHNAVSKGKSPRAAASYRGARRNAARANHGLVEWSRSCMMAIAANEKAHLGARQVQANGAREAAAKALVEARAQPTGLPGHVVGTAAMLWFYKGERRTRPVARIIRDLEKQVQA